MADMLREPQAARSGASLPKMQEVSRQKKLEVLLGYIRSAELFEDHAGGRISLSYWKIEIIVSALEDCAHDTLMWKVVGRPEMFASDSPPLVALAAHSLSNVPGHFAELRLLAQRRPRHGIPHLWGDWRDERLELGLSTVTGIPAIDKFVTPDCVPYIHKPGMIARKTSSAVPGMWQHPVPKDAECRVHRRLRIDLKIQAESAAFGIGPNITRAG